MSKKQWGHGFWQGVSASEENPLKVKEGLVGMFFIAYDTTNRKKELLHQGLVIRELRDNYYLVHHLSWFDGSPTNARIYSFEQMKEWIFFVNDYYLRRQVFYHNNPMATEADWEQAEKLNDLFHGREED